MRAHARTHTCSSDRPYFLASRYSSCIEIDAMIELFPGALRSLCATESTNHLVCFFFFVLLD